MTQSETDIQNLIRLALSERGIVNFRNHTFALKDKDGRLVRGGLCPGSSDIIAIIPVAITPEMVGQTIGVFGAIEVKRPQVKIVPDDQLNFLSVIKEHGGIAGVARSVEDAVDIVGG